MKRDKAYGKNSRLLNKVEWKFDAWKFKVFVERKCLPDENEQTVCTANAQNVASKIQCKYKPANLEWELGVLLSGSKVQ